jgi:hypothetical protein
MSDPRRMVDGGGAPFAAALLRSARADAAPEGAKQRTLAALGLSDAPAESPARARSLPARPALFQSVIGSANPRGGLWGMGRTGTAALIMLQAALIVLALFSKDEHPPAGASSPEIRMVAPRGSKVEGESAPGPQPAGTEAPLVPQPARAPEDKDQAHDDDAGAKAPAQLQPGEDAGSP